MNIEFENNNEKKVLNKAVISGLIIGIFIMVVQIMNLFFLEIFVKLEQI